MQEFIIEHKYTAQLKTITGYDIFDACNKNDIDLKYWNY